MSDTTFSIALCTYNGARFLGEQLRSYVNQERRPDELVVCDDGSSDDTLPLLRKFATEAPFPVRIESNAATLGVAANFGKAIGLCSGQIIALSDQDDVWMPQKLRRIGEVFAADPGVGMSFTDAVAIDTADQSLDYRLWDAVRFTRSERSLAQRGRLIDVLLRHYVVTGATLAFSAKYRDLILPIPPDALHDAWIGLLIGSVAKGYAIDEPLIGYRQHSTQTSGGERVMNLRAQMNRAKSQSTEVQAATAQRFAAARQRLAESDYAATSRATINRLDQKVGHVQARAAMRGLGVRRIPLILRELLSGRYYQFSHPWKAPAADLLL
jgi:glycosyltransferase involved in cell wall biosynthesis